MEMPRARSISIQSDVTPRRPALPCTAPAWVIDEACRASASVIVDLPASGWLITANVRLRTASAATAPPLIARSPGRYAANGTGGGRAGHAWPPYDHQRTQDLLHGYSEDSRRPR